MRLKDLIETLSAHPAKMKIRYDSGDQLGTLVSWRGSYDQLTLPTASPRDTCATVGEVLVDAKAAVGETFEGYKGGDYQMTEHTPVWADEYGESQCWAIAGAAVIDGVLVLNRMNVSDYR